MKYDNDGSKTLTNKSVDILMDYEGYTFVFLSKYKQDFVIKLN